MSPKSTHQKSKKSAVKGKQGPKRALKKQSLASHVLKKGSHIEIIAPGSYSPEENLIQGIDELHLWGYKVSSAVKMLKPHLNFLSNTDEQRFRFFKTAFLSKRNAAVWCLRGGYGAIRLLPLIAKMTKPRQFKLLVGLSDVTSLHIYLNQKWNWPTLHAPLLDRLALKKLNADNLSELKRVLEDPSYVTEFDNLVPLNGAAKAKRKIRSSVTGGNLMVLTSTLGTPYQINTDGKILFIEEISERSYRIDRCLHQLKQAGIFDKVKAVVFGDFTLCDEPNKENYVEETLKSFFAEMKFPVFKGIETGHGPIQRPLFFNTETHITCGDSPRMLVYSAFR